MVAVIEVRNLNKRYGDTVAVGDVSFDVAEGEIFGILGRNGAGKTTTVECIAGLRALSGGAISVLGHDPYRDRADVTRQLGIQLQDSQLPPKLRVAEALQLYASFYRHPADWRMLMDQAGLVEKAGTAYAKLSGGQKQRLSIALALVGNPRIAILDELTTGLDPQARRETWALVESVRERGVTIVLVSHFMDEAERLCDRVALIADGRVVALDTPEALTASVQACQRIRFRPSKPVDDAMFTALPEVTGVSRRGDLVEISGTGNILLAVTSALARHDVIAEQLRMDQANLEDAFVALSGHPTQGGVK